MADAKESPSPSQSPESPVPKAPPRRNHLVVSAIVIGIFAAATWIIWPRNTTPQDIDLGIPEIDLAKLERGLIAAITDAKKNIRNRPEDPEAWGRLGCVCQVHDLRQPALAAYRRAIELDEEEFRWHYFQSIVLAEDSDPATIETLQRAVDLRPQYAPALIRLGDELSRANRLDEARIAYESGLDDSPDDMHGRSALGLLRGESAPDWRDSIYYHYYEEGGHGVARHEGVRTDRYKLIHFYDVDEWEFYDLEQDPNEMLSRYADPQYAAPVEALRAELDSLKSAYRVP